jgi:chromosome segregation ATPase
MTEGDINELIREQKTGDELRQLLQSVLALRKAKEARQNQLGVAERLALEIAAEQSRIAANMKTLERLHPLYKSYVAKLQTLEDELTVRRKEKAELIEAANELNRQLSEVAPSKKQLESTLDKPLPQKSDDPFDH